nr:MAG: hypothetical protein [Bacteriophage sp.]
MTMYTVPLPGTKITCEDIMTVKIKERTPAKTLVHLSNIEPGQFFVYSSEHSARTLQLRTSTGAVIVETGVHDEDDIYSKHAVFEVIPDVDILWG